MLAYTTLVPSTVYLQRPDDTAKIFIFDSANHMERSRPPVQSHHPPPRRTMYNPSLQQPTSPARDRPFPYTAPLGQTQWTAVPPYEAEQYPVRGPCQPTISVDHDCTPAPPRERSRRRRFRDLLLRPNNGAEDEAFDVERLYPQLSPYVKSDRHSTVSAPDELEYHHARSLTELEFPDYTRVSSPITSHEPPHITMPRSPTYPPSGSRRMRSATGVTDAAFADEEEFRLFVQATVGLGIEQRLRVPHSHSSSHPPLARSQSNPFPSQQMRIEEPVSPLDDTPTAMRALQQLPQMPEGSRQRHIERPALNVIALDDWLGRTYSEARRGEVSPLEEDFDDELPDYAESQAQAQAHRRVEATRRAQELQRRWQQSGRRRGF